MAEVISEIKISREGRGKKPMRSTDNKRNMLRKANGHSLLSNKKFAQLG
jgi:ribonuclease PH